MHYTFSVDQGTKIHLQSPGNAKDISGVNFTKFGGLSKEFASLKHLLILVLSCMRRKIRKRRGQTRLLSYKILEPDLRRVFEWLISIAINIIFVMWFSIKSNKTCDVCKQGVHNLSIILLKVKNPPTVVRRSASVPNGYFLCILLTVGFYE